jgi:RimJ/RimL family protein N-acetyltransferase
MHMPTPTSHAISAPRSAGPQPLPVTAAPAYDPAQTAWIDPTRPDDLDPQGEDPLAGADDALARRGLTLRPWAPDDLDAFCARLDDTRVWAYLPETRPDPFDPDQGAALIAIANRVPGHIVRAVLCDGEVLGQVRLDLGAGPGAAELSYWLGAAYWGQGFGSALVAGAAERAFARMPDLLRLTAKVHPDNPASARVLAKAGFRPCPAPGTLWPDWRWFHLRRQDHLGRGISSEASP